MHTTNIYQGHSFAQHPSDDPSMAGRQGSTGARVITGIDRAVDRLLAGRSAVTIEAKSFIIEVSMATQPFIALKVGCLDWGARRHGRTKTSAFARTSSVFPTARYGGMQ